MSHKSLKAIINFDCIRNERAHFGKMRGLGLKEMIQYPGTFQTTAIIISKKNVGGGQERDSFDYRQGLQSEKSALNRVIGLQRDSEDAQDLLYLHAIIDHEAHVTLDVEINNLAALTLVNSEAIGIFMHPRFVEKCNAILLFKVAPREVKVIDGPIINSGLIMHKTIVEVVVGDH